jgi:hypothetical protein
MYTWQSLDKCRFRGLHSRPLARQPRKTLAPHGLAALPHRAAGAGKKADCALFPATQWRSCRRKPSILPAGVVLEQ